MGQELSCSLVDPKMTRTIHVSNQFCSNPLQLVWDECAESLSVWVSVGSLCDCTLLFFLTDSCQESRPQTGSPL